MVRWLIGGLSVLLVSGCSYHNKRKGTTQRGVKQVKVVFGEENYLVPAKRVVGGSNPIILNNSHYFSTPYDKVLSLSSRKDSLYRVTSLEIDSTSNEKYIVFRIMSSEEQNLNVIAYYESNLEVMLEQDVPLDLWESCIVVDWTKIKKESFWIVLTDSRNGIYKSRIELD
jgi:hypothetical protein